jgi:hypothetical protein
MSLVFALAFIGYVLLGVTVACHFWRQPRRWLHILTAAVVLVHVCLVWDWRFHWSLTYAWEKSVAGFLVFHIALALILTAAVVPMPWARWCVLAAFPIVTAGAVAATFRYEEVMVYQVPMAATLITVVAVSPWGFWKRKTNCNERPMSSDNPGQRVKL